MIAVLTIGALICVPFAKMAPPQAALEKRTFSPLAHEASSARVGTTKRAINAAANRTTLLAPKTAVAPLKS